jgi:sphingolipid delta-4 desaturase
LITDSDNAHSSDDPPVVPTPYVMIDAPSQHAGRAQRILRAHPEIRELFGPNRWSALCIAAIVSAQVALSAGLASAPWWALVLAAYLPGAYANHALWVLVHECCHNLVAASKTANRWWAVVANLAMGIPTTVGFCIYHLQHHKFLGDYERDPDIAMRWEAWLMHGGFARRFLWNCLFPFILGVRTVVAKKDGRNINWVRMNLPAALIVIAFDAALFYLFGVKAVVYLILSNFFSVAAHPVSARWIQEHYVFRDGQETYDYYGPLNRIAFNIGYHNEHHDLPKVAWSRLPRVREIAAEHYDTLYAHRSWTGLWLRFLFEKELHIFRFARLKRRPRAA